MCVYMVCVSVCCVCMQCVCVCVCEGCPVYCRMLSSISGLYLVNVLLHTATV